MRVLHVIHRVFIGGFQRHVDVENEFRVGLARDQEEAHGVAALGDVAASRPFDQVAHGYVGAGALRNLDFFAVLHDGDHLVQHVVGVALRDTHVDRLQAGAHARDGAVVVAALDIDGLHEAALPFHQVIRDVRHEIRVGAVRLAHDAVLVVAEVGGAQPQRAILLIGVARLDQGVHRAVDLAVRVQRGFQVVIVEFHAEGLQVDILLVAQVGDGERADRIDVVDVAVGRGGQAIAGRHRLAGLEVVGDIGDVVAVVGRFRPFGVARLEAARARLHGIGQCLNLHARVVIVELARHLVALRVE